VKWLRRIAEAVRGLFLPNLVLKVLSIAIAFGLWFFVNAAERDSEATLTVGLLLREIPPNVMLVSPRVDSVELRVSGPRTLLSRIDPEKHAIELDLKGVRAGPTTFRIRPNALDLPRGVTVVRMMPSEVTLEFARVKRKSVPVHLSLGAPPPGDLRIVESAVRPEVVEIIGPTRDVDELSAVETEVLDLAEARAGVIEREIGLQLPSSDLSTTATSVKVQLRLAEPEATRTFKNVPVVVRNSPTPATVKPEKVTVAVRGPKSKIETLELGHGAVYIDATDYKPGQLDVVPAVALPPDVTLVRKIGAVKLTVTEEIQQLQTPMDANSSVLPAEEPAAAQTRAVDDR